MKNEAEMMQSEWLDFAKDDLESARVILKETDSYHISFFHSHQAVEKLFKWFLLKNNRKFPFSHDLKELFKLVCDTTKAVDRLEDVLFLDNLYPQLRYPTGEQVSKDEAKQALSIAEKLFKQLT